MTDEKKPLILCIDDEPAILLILENVLQEEGYDVLLAKGGLEALEMLNTARPDVIILDAMMPGYSGHQLSIRIQANRNLMDVPIIFLSGADLELHKGLALSMGAAAFLQKPLRAEELKAEVRKQCEKRSSAKAASEPVTPAPEPNAKVPTKEIPPETGPSSAETDASLEAKRPAAPAEEPAASVKDESKPKTEHAPPDSGASSPSEPVAAPSSGSAPKEDAPAPEPAKAPAPRLRPAESSPIPAEPRRKPSAAAMQVEFPAFKGFLSSRLTLDDESLGQLQTMVPEKIYETTGAIGVPSSQVAKYAAQFFGFEYLPNINPETIRWGMFAPTFMRANGVLGTMQGDVEAAILSNPFNTELMALLRGRFSKIFIADPENILMFTGRDKEPALKSVLAGDRVAPAEIADHLLELAIYRGASDIHVEPKDESGLVRFRVRGDMSDAFEVKAETGQMIISRFKAMAGLDIAEHRKPQDGSMEVTIREKEYVLRLATSSTANGESLVMRILQPNQRPKKLQELGMSERQVVHMLDFAMRTQGLLLVVGATGAGKTTTVYSLLNEIDRETRSLISVEDPVEYRIPGANQQQVSLKAGTTFEAMLKSSVRQDPDILFIGEMRDPQSARIAVDFASTGHLTISTLHTSNATTAIFRLERLELTRAVLADALIAIVAQRLIKVLCPNCRKIVPMLKEDADRLRPFLPEPPKAVAYPVGCVKCGDTGYIGREAVYEILRFYPEVQAMVRENKPITEIRRFVKSQGDILMGEQAIDKMRQFTFSPKDIMEAVLTEEAPPSVSRPAPAAPTTSTPSAFSPPAPVARPSPGGSSGGARILVVEDSATIQTMAKMTLEQSGMNVTTAGDGIEALMEIGRTRFDLIISDINMPNMDGFQLLEVLMTKKIDTPVIFFTSSDKQETEMKGLKMGVADFLQKPIQADLLLARVQHALRR